MKAIIQKVMDKLVISCRKASFLISKSQDETLSFKEKMDMNIHLAGCHICRQYKKDVGTMQRYLSEMPKNQKVMHLTEEQKQNMKQSMNGKFGDTHEHD